ncbi:MAG: hypothetical protein IKZ19_01985, partial [Clostridia bacterium]|nr:hypothetical protein [Clostridia bacterium]
NTEKKVGKVFMESRIVFENGTPFLTAHGKKVPAVAYITYFEELNDYKAFADKGFELFSVCVSLGKQPINTNTGFVPHRGGAFTEKGKPDFSAADRSVQMILDACPEAYIFPRIYVCMPQWWIDENPTETVAVAHGCRREALWSEKFRADSAEMLKELLRHFEESPFADRIIGYQISGGMTEEWFHLDLRGSCCENALPGFRKYTGDENALLPDLSLLESREVLDDENLTNYIRFANDSAAESAEYLCRTAKEFLGYRKIVGAFYGYTLEVCEPLWGTNSLAKLLDSPYIDFFSSPNSYVDLRAMGVDWPDMMPVDSVKLRGKMVFMECDIRTFLTVSPGEARPGADPHGMYLGGVFKGPPTEELSVWAVRKSLARQLTHKHGLWWFDMFGHWYATPALMAEMEMSRKLFGRTGEDFYEYPPETALILDETYYSKLGKRHKEYHTARVLRNPLGRVAAPFDVYLSSDIDRVDWEHSAYKAVICTVPGDRAFAVAVKSKLEPFGISCLDAEKAPSLEELRSFLKESGVFLFSEDGDVVYFGNGYIAVHGASAGEKTLKLPQKALFLDLLTGEETVGDTVKLTLKQYETRIFKLTRVK